MKRRNNQEEDHSVEQQSEEPRRFVKLSDQLRAQADDMRAHADVFKVAADAMEEVERVYASSPSSVPTCLEEPIKRQKVAVIPVTPKAKKEPKKVAEAKATKKEKEATPEASRKRSDAEKRIQKEMLRLDNYEAEKYLAVDAEGNPSMARARELLDMFGVCVCPGVLRSSECEEMVQGVWDFAATVTAKAASVSLRPVKRDDPTTWKTAEKMLVSHGVQKNWGVGHAGVMWRLRQHPTVLTIFSQLWGVDKSGDDLLTSLDGFSLVPPPETTGNGWQNRSNAWLHCDQSFLRPGFRCWQSWVTGVDVKPGDGTFCFLEGSHKHHSAFQQRFQTTEKDDWFMLKTDQHINFYTHEKACTLKHIACPKGSMVIWDSRLIHSGCGPIRGRPHHRERCVAYLCFMPRHMASEADLQKKREAFESQRTTSHWPVKTKLVPELKTGPRGIDISWLQSGAVKPEMTPKLKRLLGYDD